MQMPLVSVIIPVYNGSDYLKEAIDSVLEQTYPYIEVIVVNDGSIDYGKTEKIALSYGEKIRYICKENGGVATALNMGIDQMEGDYFSWLSHDDVLYPEKIEKQVQILENGKARITACAYNIFYDSGRHLPMPIVDMYGVQIIQNSVFSVLHSLIQFGGVLFKKEIFDEYGVFRTDLRTTQDYEFLFRILRKERCIYSNEILYGIRYHENQGSNIISCVNRERDEMYQMFLQELSQEERERMYGSSYNFYYQMLLRVWPLPNMDKSVNLCMEGLRKERAESSSQEKKQRQQILIYGAGIYGRRLLFDLRCRGINVAGFIDGNRKLWGTTIDGVPCFGTAVLDKKDMAEKVIIAAIFREEMASVLREKGISAFWFKEQWERTRLKTAPKWEKIQEVIGSYDKR